MAKRSRHTKGPWRVFRNDRQYHCTLILDSDTRKYMAAVEVPHINYSKKWRKENPQAMREHRRTLREVEANAALIAASPTLLDALQRLLKAPNSKVARAAAAAAVADAKTVKVKMDAP